MVYDAVAVLFQLYVVEKNNIAKIPVKSCSSHNTEEWPITEVYVTVETDTAAK